MPHNVNKEKMKDQTIDSSAKESDEIKTLNATFEAVLSIHHVGIIVVDETGKTTFVNKAFAEFLSSSPDVMIGRHITDIIASSKLHMVAESGVSAPHEIISIQGKTLVFSGMPIKIDGKVIGAVGKAVFPQTDEIRELANKLRSLENEVTFLKEELQTNKNAENILNEIVSQNSKMRKLKDEIRIVASGSSTVLITGESGTGKERVAQAVHACSDRAKGPFITIDCTAIPENLMEAELFGYVEGAFTGAVKGGKPGRLEIANGGTLFLDEIGDMPLALQSKLLRVLQEREFERLGSIKSTKINVRIIAATNKNLSKAVSTGEFRGDLYYRLNVINLHLPPLRERIDDIELLSRYFITKFNYVLNHNVAGITADAVKVLQNYSWPGNIRELENVIERAVNYTHIGFIRFEQLPDSIIGNTAGEGAPETLEAKGTIPHRAKIGQIERQMIVTAIEQAGGNKAEAARTLNISRSRLYDKLIKYNLKL